MKPRLLLVVFLVSSFGRAGGRGNVPLQTEGSPQAPQVNAAEYSNSEIVLETQTLPPRYQGNDLPRLFLGLQDLQKRQVKGEFETTGQFEERKKLDASKPLLGALGLNSVFAFECDPSDARYDADAQKLQVKLGLWPMPQNAAVGAVRYKLEAGPSTSYQGTNAFGATIEVSRSEFAYYQILFAIPSGFPSAVVSDIRLPAEQAKTQKDAIKVLVICRLVPPFLRSTATHHEPTFQEPTESTFETRSLWVKLLQVWFYDINSGSILSRFSAQEPSAQAEPVSPPASGPAMTGGTSEPQGVAQALQLARQYQAMSKKDKKSEAGRDVANQFCATISSGGYQGPTKREARNNYLLNHANTPMADLLEVMELAGKVCP